MKDILFNLKKVNIIGKFISIEGEFIVGKTKQDFKKMNNERPTYQGVVELAFLAMTPEQLLLF